MSSLLAEIRGQEGILSFHQKTVGCSVELTVGKKVIWGYEPTLWHWKGSWVPKFMLQLPSDTKWQGALCECWEQRSQAWYFCLVIVGPLCPPQPSDRETDTRACTSSMWFPIGTCLGDPRLCLGYWAVCLIMCHLFLDSQQEQGKSCCGIQTWEARVAAAEFRMAWLTQ